MVKFEGPCWAFFGRFVVKFSYFFGCPRVKNRVICNVFVPLASKKSF